MDTAIRSIPDFSNNTRQRFKVMKFARCLGAFILLLSGIFAMGQYDDWEEEPESDWGFRFSGRAMFNLELSVTESSLPTAAGYYDDGFALPDVSGSSTTWNWGYDSASQGNVAANEVQFTRLNNLPALGSYSESQGVSFGGELIGTYELFETLLKDKVIVGGIELGYGYQPVSIDYSSNATTSATYVQSFHSLGNVVPPAGPYAGTFDGPGPLISLSPVRTISTTANATSSYSGELSGDFHIVKVGLWGEMDLAERWTLGLSGGLSSVYADTVYSFRNNTTFDNPNVPAQSESGNIGGREWMAGIYTQVRIQYNITENFGAFVGGEVELHSDFDFQGGGKQFVMEMAPLYGGILGINWQF